MTTRTISPLDNHLGYWLRFVSNHVSLAFRRKVEALGVTVAEWVVMRVILDAAGINPSQLAERIGLTRGAVSKLIDRLTAKGLVTCRAVKADRRYQTLHLTAAGRQLVPVLARLADQNDAEFFDHLSPTQQATLKIWLQDIVRRQGLKSVPMT